MVIKVGYDGWVQNFMLKLFLNHNFEGKSSLSFSVAVEKADGHVTYFFPIRNLQNRLCLFILETCISVLGNFLLLLKKCTCKHTHTHFHFHVLSLVFLFCRYLSSWINLLKLFLSSLILQFIIVLLYFQRDFLDFIF